VSKIDYILEFITTTDSRNDASLSLAMTQILCKISIIKEDQSKGPAGTLCGYIVNLNADVVDEFYAPSQQLYDFVQLVKVSHAKAKSMDGIRDHVLFINSLYIDDRYRGNELGINAIQSMTKIMGYGCTAVFILPCPTEIPLDDPGFDKAKQGLREYYSRIGLEPFEDTDYMYFKYRAFGVK